MTHRSEKEQRERVKTVVQASADYASDLVAAEIAALIQETLPPAAPPS